MMKHLCSSATYSKKKFLGTFLNYMSLKHTMFHQQHVFPLVW